MTDWLSLPTSDGPMRAFVATPHSGLHRAVVVLQEAFGVNANIRDVCVRFAERGWLAIAPDLFHRTGVGELPYDRHARAVGLVGEIGPDAILMDVRAVLDHLRKLGFALDRCAIVGFCFGGRAAVTAATDVAGLGAAVAFYGPGVAAGPHAVIDRAARITAPLLLHVGEDDPTIPKEHVQATKQALEAAGVRFQQYVYPQAGHAFACDARPNMFRAEPAGLAWQRTLAFLDEHVPPQH